MTKISKVLGFFIILFFLLKFSVCDDFPSLLMANASIAILLDREYLDKNYENTLNEVKIIIERVLREDLKNGGLIVNYYSWTMIDFRKDFTAVLSVSNCKDTWQIFKDSRPESVLLIALTDPDCPRLPPDEAVMIPIMVLGEELPQFVLDMKSSKTFDVKSAVVLHDDAFDRDIISRVILAVTTESPDGYVKPMSVSIFKLKSLMHEWERRKSLRTTLSSIPTRYTGTNFIVIVKANTVENVMETAKDLGMVHPLSKWLYIISDTNAAYSNISGVRSLINEGDNIAFAYNFTSVGKECVYGIKCHAADVLRSFVLGLSRMIKEEKSIYGQISDEEWEAIRPTKREKRDNILNFMIGHLKDSSICANCSTWNIDSGEVWGMIYKSWSSLTNGDIWEDSVSQKQPPPLLKVGTWSPATGCSMVDALFPHASHGFRRKELHILTYHNPPWQIITYNDSGVPGFVGGLTFDILNELSHKLNFTYVLHVTSANAGSFNDSDTLLGTSNNTEIGVRTVKIPSDVLNTVGNNKIFMAAVGVTVLEHYKFVLNYTMPISIQTYTFIVSRPKELSRIYLFLSPFAWDTWFGIMISIACMSPLLYGIHRLSPYYAYFGKRESGGLYTINNCFWYIYGALLQQGGLYLPQADSGRLLVGTWWIVVLIVVTTYCGNLVAYLTFPKNEAPITNVNQILRRDGSMTWSIKSGSYLEEYLKETDIPKHKRLFSGANFYTFDNPNLIDSVRRGKHIIFDWKMNLDKIMKKEFIENNRCDFSLASDDLLDEKISLLLPRNSPYLDLVNAEIKRLHQMGFIEKWLKKYLTKSDRCTNIKISSEVTNHTVNLNDMQGCFLVLLFGVIGSILLIIIEYIWNRYQVKKESSVIKPFIE